MYKERAFVRVGCRNEIPKLPKNETSVPRTYQQKFLHYDEILKGGWKVHQLA